ncbi:MAG: hypothetical protein J6Q67_05375, partial [Clostridia bacterium]|nr:hypothetical protein [Clostridia bacterium]
MKNLLKIFPGLSLSVLVAGFATLIAWLLEETLEIHLIGAAVIAMFIGMLIGMVLGITGLGTKLPTSIDSVISVSASCMSPVAMLLTGITVAGIDFKKTLKLASIY